MFMNMMMMSAANSRADPGLQSEIRLSDSVESLLQKIYREQKRGPILAKTRRMLAAASEESARETLLKIISRPVVPCNPVLHSLDGLICWLLNSCHGQSPRRFGGSPVFSSSSASGTFVHTLSFQEQTTISIDEYGDESSEDDEGMKEEASTSFVES